MSTSFEKKCEILGALWSEFREEEDWEDFFETNDLGLPLSFMLDMGLASNPSPLGKSFIEQSFILLLARLKLEDVGWESLEEMIDKSGEL